MVKMLLNYHKRPLYSIIVAAQYCYNYGYEVWGLKKIKSTWALSSEHPHFKYIQYDLTIQI